MPRETLGPAERETLLGFPVAYCNALATTEIMIVAANRTTLAFNRLRISFARIRRSVRRSMLRDHHGQAPKARRSKRAKRLL